MLQKLLGQQKNEASATLLIADQKVNVISETTLNQSEIDGGKKLVDFQKNLIVSNLLKLIKTLN
ncbi:hypothetical protein [Lactiplantibacillus paraplantarum]|uniref:hypothetical protein n=1 Tax=Lactiplantibacillus paraplantarum TaxID=60520 RepID=UPI0023AAB697|nr:hypothetical protein [Lactiplantibacillus paraplantarum]WEE35961.1 hypothetical protein PWO93_14920 [Lactiplantibacillus paraplantarum]